MKAALQKAHIDKDKKTDKLTTWANFFLYPGKSSILSQKLDASLVTL